MNDFWDSLFTLLRLDGDGERLVEQIAATLQGSSRGILAATLAGASHLTLPFETLRAMIENPLSREAIENFSKEGVGLQV